MKKLSLLFLLIAAVTFSASAREVLHLKGSERMKMQPAATSDLAYGLYGNVFSTDGSYSFREMTFDPINPGILMFQGEMNAGSFFYVIYDRTTKEILYQYGISPEHPLMLGNLNVYAYESDPFVVPKGNYDIRIGYPYILICNEDNPTLDYYDSLIVYWWADTFEMDVYLLNISLPEIKNPGLYLNLNNETGYTLYPLYNDGTYQYYTDFFPASPNSRIDYATYLSFQSDDTHYSGALFEGYFVTSSLGYNYSFDVIDAGEDYAEVSFSFSYNFMKEKEFVLNYTVWEQYNESNRLTGTYTSNEPDGTFTIRGLKPNTFYVLDIIGEIVSEYGTLFPDYTEPGSFATKDQSGVSGIDADSDAEVKYFSTDGRQVSDPQKGVYIKVQGRNITKVVL